MQNPPNPMPGFQGNQSPAIMQRPPSVQIPSNMHAISAPQPPLGKRNPLIQIPPKEYNKNPIIVNEKPVESEPPAMIIDALNTENIAVFKDIINHFKDFWKNDHMLQLDEAKNNLSLFADTSISFKKEVYQSFRQLVSIERDSSSLDFWKQMIEAAEEYLSENDRDDLLKILYERIDGKEVEYEFRQINSRGHAPTGRRRPGSRAGHAQNQGYGGRFNLSANEDVDLPDSWAAEPNYKPAEFFPSSKTEFQPKPQANPPGKPEFQFKVKNPEILPQVEANYRPDPTHLQNSEIYHEPSLFPQSGLWDQSPKLPDRAPLIPASPKHTPSISSGGMPPGPSLPNTAEVPNPFLPRFVGHPFKKPSDPPNPFSNLRSPKNSENPMPAPNESPAPRSSHLAANLSAPPQPNPDARLARSADLGQDSSGPRPFLHPIPSPLPPMVSQEPLAAKTDVLPISKLLEILTNDGLNIINRWKGSYEELMSLNELLTAIKANIKLKSPSAIISLIGSSYIGTYLKATDVDVVLTDYLSPDPIGLLTSTISSLGLGRTQQITQRVLFTPSSLPQKYNFYINDEISFEASALIREYCKLDSRCHDLIMLSKLWIRGKNIVECINGFHISLIVICFLQISDPAVLPRLQQPDHQCKLIGNHDIWFENNSTFESTNTFSLGELFQLFLIFLQDLLAHDYNLDIKQGLVRPCTSDFLYSTSHPFTGNEVSRLLKSSAEASKWISTLGLTLAALESGEKLQKILNLS